MLPAGMVTVEIGPHKTSMFIYDFTYVVKSGTNAHATNAATVLSDAEQGAINIFLSVLTVPFSSIHLSLLSMSMFPSLLVTCPLLSCPFSASSD